MSMRPVAEELFWFLSGSTDENDLAARGVGIWKEWRQEGADGDLGPIYGRQWRAFPGRGSDTSDQIARVFKILEADPTSRRAVVSAWNPSELDAMALHPCHALFQFVQIGGRLNLIMHQRSADVFLGLPFNIASYGLLLELFAYALNVEAGHLMVNIGDVHLYENALTAAMQQTVHHAMISSGWSRPRLDIRLSRQSIRNCLLYPHLCKQLRWNPQTFAMIGHAKGPHRPVAVAL
jgi:thymidylate synthase